MFIFIFFFTSITKKPKKNMAFIKKINFNSKKKKTHKKFVYHHIERKCALIMSLSMCVCNAVHLNLNTKIVHITTNYVLKNLHQITKNTQKLCYKMPSF